MPLNECCLKDTGTNHYKRSSQGTVQMSYSFVNRQKLSTSEPDSEPQELSSSTSSDVFHTRQITYPVNVTVYHTLEFSNLDIIPLFASASPLTPIPSAISLHSSSNDLTTSLLDVPPSEQSDYCLVSVDVSNIYGLPFDVTLERHQEGMCPFEWIGKGLQHIISEH